LIGKKVLSSKPVSLAEVKEMLKERSEKGELTYEQNLTSEYVKKFSKLSKSRVDKALAEFMAVEGVTDELATKLADILPQSMERLKLIVPKNAKFSEEQLGQLLSICKQYEKE